MKKLFASALALCLVTMMSTGCTQTGAAKSSEITSTLAVSSEASAVSTASTAHAIDMTGFLEGFDPSDVGEKKIGIVPWSMAQEFNSICANTAKQRCEQLGWKAEIYDPNGDWAKMKQIIEDLIIQGVDGIIFTAIDGSAASDLVDLVHEKGILIVDYDCTADRGNADMDAVYDDYLGGWMAGEYLMEALGGKEDAQIIVYESEPSIVTSVSRNDGFLGFMKEKYPNVKIIQSRTTNRTNDGFYQWASDVIIANPVADGIFCNQGDLATSVWNAMQDSEIGRNLYLVGYDATSSHLDIMLKDGPDCKFYASIGISPTEYATICVQKLNEIWGGKYLRKGPDDKVQLTPIPLLARDAVG